jgi:hypothetical protein
MKADLQTNQSQPERVGRCNAGHVREQVRGASELEREAPFADMPVQDAFRIREDEGQRGEFIGPGEIGETDIEKAGSRNLEWEDESLCRLNELGCIYKHSLGQAPSWRHSRRERKQGHSEHAT